MAVMDFGCGMGMFSIAAARLVGDHGRVVAVDLQARMLDVLRKRAAKAGVAERISTHLCQADAIGLQDSFDFVLAMYSAHEAPDLRHLLAEIRNCLRPQGELMVVEPIGHVTAADFQQLLTAARETGYEEAARPRVCLSRAVVLRRR
jgi:ubiquinone/menaquinone biosynthesis C-methylase UbiE